MFQQKLTQTLLNAVEESPCGISNLGVLESLKLADSFTLKTTLSRLCRTGRLLRLKRGVYSTNPMKDAYVAAQSTFNGYLGFSSALHIHGLITEIPFSIAVVTTDLSKKKKFGEYQFLAVALKEKAIGFQQKGEYVVSTRPKTLFDCLYLPKYSVEQTKLIEAFRQAKLSKVEWKEFDGYAKKFSNRKMQERMNAMKEAIRGREND